MTRITNTDQVLALLRARLERSARARRGTAKSAQRSRPTPLVRLQEMASGEELSESDIARAVIAGLLAEEFGEDVVAESRFQQIVDEVRRLIEADEQSSTRLKIAVRDLVKQVS